jgi:hypothetical protein
MSESKINNGVNPKTFSNVPFEKTRINKIIDETLPGSPEYPKWVTSTDGVTEENEEGFQLALDCLISDLPGVAKFHKTLAIKFKRGTPKIVVRKMYLYDAICRNKPHTISSVYDYADWLFKLCSYILNEQNYSPDVEVIREFRDKISSQTS